MRVMSGVSRTLLYVGGDVWKQGYEGACIIACCTCLYSGQFELLIFRETLGQRAVSSSFNFCV